MAPYVTAINGICQEVIESKEINAGLSLEKVVALPFFLHLDKKFRESLIPNPEHVVRGGLLFSMKIFHHLGKRFKANGTDNDEDKSRPNLGGWWSSKSDALDALVYPKLQARCQRGDLGIFKTGIVLVSKGQIPERLDFSEGCPSSLKGIGTTHFFGFTGYKFSILSRGGQSEAREDLQRFFRNLS